MNPLFADRIGANTPPTDPAEERRRKLEAQLRAMSRSFAPEATRVDPDPRGGSDPLLSILRFGAEVAPVTGEVLSALDAKQQFDEGNYGMAALSGLGALPGIGMMGRVAKQGAKVAKGAKSAGDAVEALAGVTTGQSVRRARLPEVTDEMAQAQKIPGAGLFRKPEEGVTKTSPLPSVQEIRERLEEARNAVRKLEMDAPSEPWRPTERGVFDRTGFDPNYRMLPNTNSMVQVTGRMDPELASLLDNKYLRDLLERQAVLGLERGGKGFYNLRPIANSFEEMSGPNSFRDFVGAKSAGSIQASLPLEMSNASIMLYAKANDIPYTEAIQELARRYPNASKPWASGTHFNKFDQYRDTGSIDPLESASGARKLPYYFRQSLGESTPPGGRQSLGESTPPGGSMGAVIDAHEGKAALFPVGAERYIEQLTGQQYEQVADVYRDLAKRLGVPVETFQAGRWFGGGPLTGLKSPQGDYMQGLEDVLAWSAQQMGKGTDPKSLRRYWQDVTQGRDFILPFYGKGAPPVR